MKHIFTTATFTAISFLGLQAQVQKDMTKEEMWNLVEDRMYQNENRSLIHITPAPGAEPCGTMEARRNQITADPSVEEGYRSAENAIQQWLQTNAGRFQKTGSVITIPVVVHVLYKDATQNISDAQIQSQIDVLNADFRRMNADTSGTPSVFKPIAADCEIEFCLATVDPNGNPTTGIHRVSTTGGILFGYFGPTDDAKASSTGGTEPWPMEDYLNVWVCDLIPIILGYAQFPGGPAATDGVVIGFNYFGTTGTVTAPYDRGRTSTHEVGHWLGLYHIWGDGDCTASDSVADTPPAGAATSGCPIGANTCTEVPDVQDMIQNYMDYSDDDCMNLFTLGQKDRMWATLNTSRLSLQSSPGCSGPASVADAPVRDVRIYPNPAQDKLHIDLHSATVRSFSVRIMNMQGVVLLQQETEFASGTAILSTTALAPGMYVVEVKSGSDMRQEKIMIAR